MAGRRQHEEEEHENHERWLVTYADMVTLLMVLFIVMFAMSQVDERKYYELRAGLADGFGESVLNGGGAVTDDPGAADQITVAPQLAMTPMPPEATDADSKAMEQAVAKGVASNESLRRDRAAADQAVERERLGGVAARLSEALRANGLEDDVKTSFDGRGLVISLVSRHVVFERDMATLSPRGAQVLATLAPVLRDIPDPLEVDGHTNQAPGKPANYATDWDLSAARALTVLRTLNTRYGLETDRLSLSAFGHTKPLVPVSRPDSQEINKRVDIVVLTTVAGGLAVQPESAGRERGQDEQDPGRGSPGVSAASSPLTPPDDSGAPR